ncbi:MAG TPA: DUF6334 family protein [Candidatus Methylacidiphilales bacterium]|nr:DUF6334 family protein [Candidatus Methylacidiphilales bacterium]
MSTPDINDFAREALLLERMVYVRHEDLDGIAAVEMQFEGGRRIVLRIVPKTDELAPEPGFAASVKTEDLASAFPFVGRAYRSCLRWAWKMKNHQGYDDAVQVEFTDDNLVTTAIIQFKAVGSFIYICEVQDQSL